MNNKGFTLIELLAVIVILAIIGTITRFSVNNTINNSQKEVSDIQKNNIEQAAKIYYLKEGMNEDTLELEEYESCVNLSVLIEKGYIEDAFILDAVSKKEMNGSIKITFKDNVFTYKYVERTCD